MEDPEGDDTVEVICVCLNNHKPPYWCAFLGKECMSLNLNYGATGPIEEGYEFRLTDERKGWWWSEPINENYKGTK